MNAQQPGQRGKHSKVGLHINHETSIEEKNMSKKKGNNLPSSSERSHTAGIKECEFLHGEEEGGQKRG